MQILLKRDYRICTIHLIDAHHCTDASKYISAVLLSLQSMLMLETPHINVLSKVDLIESYGKTAFDIDFYTEVQDLTYLFPKPTTESSPFTIRNHKLSMAICDLISDFGLVGFQTCCIQDKESVANIVAVIDRANGYIFGGEYGSSESLKVVMKEDVGNERVRELWMNNS
ncbi:hypothetical protein HK096_008236 [Nowakowskiella sp. JEL0078]|nr:hypothetical protein HK096_008236 [Nowakowskiella sp. JEL0078]